MAAVPVLIVPHATSIGGEVDTRLGTRGIVAQAMDAEDKESTPTNLAVR